MTDPVTDPRKPDLLSLTAEVTAAYLGKNTVALAQLPDVIRTIYASLGGISSGAASAALPAEAGKPAVSIKKSITAEYIICLEDGKKLKMLKRHLRTVYNLTPDQYRAKWGLPNDYPMVAPKYAEQRSVFAKRIGLGKGATGRPAKKRAA